MDKTEIIKKSIKRNVSFKPIGKGQIEPPSKLKGKGGITDYYGSGPNSIGQKLIDDVTQGAKTYQEGIDQGGTKGMLKSTAGLLGSAFRTAGDFAGGIYAPIGMAAEPIIKATGLPKILNKIGPAFDTGIQKLTGSRLTDVPEVQKFAMKYPQAGEDFTRGLNLLMAGMDKTKISPNATISVLKSKIKSLLPKPIEGGIQEYPLKNIKTMLQKTGEFALDQDTVDRANMLKSKLQDLKSRNIDLGEGAFHGAKLGREVKIPVDVKGLDQLIEGNHRTLQQIMNNGGLKGKILADLDLGKPIPLSQTIPSSIRVNLQNGIDSLNNYINKEGIPFDKIYKVYGSPIYGDVYNKNMADWIISDTLTNLKRNGLGTLVPKLESILDPNNLTPQKLINSVNYVFKTGVPNELMSPTITQPVVGLGSLGAGMAGVTNKIINNKKKK